ncbi:uncharacterized protein LOC144124103 [Amblyomma americanum]
MSRKAAAAVPSVAKAANTGEDSVYATAESKVYASAAETAEPAAGSSQKGKTSASGGQVQGSALAGDAGGAKQNPSSATSKESEASQDRERLASGHQNWVPFPGLYFLAMLAVLSVLITYMSFAVGQPDDATTDPDNKGGNRTAAKPALPITPLATDDDVESDRTTEHPPEDGQEPSATPEEISDALEADN